MQADHVMKGVRMHVEINPILSTNIQFCEEFHCINPPLFTVEVRRPQEGSLELHHVCGEHVRDALPEFSNAA